MLESTPTQGSVEPATSDAVKREYAARSLEYNLRNPTFKKLFPKYAKADGQEEDEDEQESEEAGAGAGAGVAALDLKAAAAPAAAGSASPSADEAQAADHESASAASAAAAPAAAAAAPAPVAAPAPAAAAAAGGGPVVKVLQLGALGSIRADQLYDFALALIALLAVGVAAVLCALR